MGYEANDFAGRVQADVMGELGLEPVTQSEVDQALEGYDDSASPVREALDAGRCGKIEG